MTANTVQQQTQELPWWLVLIDGIAAIIIGILLFTNTAATVGTLVLFLGIYWLIKGIIILIGIFQDRAAWGWKLFIGILSILAGLIVTVGMGFFAAALMVTTTFAIVIGIWGVVIGIMEIISAFRGEGWGVGILGVISIVFGIYIMANPMVSGFALVYVAAIFAVVGGIIAVVQAFRLR
ncbi:MAG: hypothetical protein GY759_24255 [Chloroflexi bacterium]|nr:hypothetical protein [Chloroflexota bacterium]